MTGPAFPVLDGFLFSVLCVRVAMVAEVLSLRGRS